MNEISKNAPSIPQQKTKVEQVKTEPVLEPAVTADDVQVREIKEIPENPADRTSVRVDNIERDIALFVSNPKLAAMAMDIAGLAEKKYTEQNVEFPEIKALAVGRAFIEEFQK